MLVKELIAKLFEYNQEANVKVTVHDEMCDFSISYGTSEGCTKETADVVDFCVDKLNTQDKEQHESSD